MEHTQRRAQILDRAMRERPPRDAQEAVRLYADACTLVQHTGDRDVAAVAEALRIVHGPELDRLALVEARMRLVTLALRASGWERKPAEEKARNLVPPLQANYEPLFQHESLQEIEDSIALPVGGSGPQGPCTRALAWEVRALLEMPATVMPWVWLD